MTNLNRTDASISGYQGATPQPNTITFWHGNQTTMAMKIHADGLIELGDHVRPTEAAMVCIEAMGDIIQRLIEEVRAKDADRIEALEMEVSRWERIAATLADHAFGEKTNAG